MTSSASRAPWLFAVLASIAIHGAPAAAQDVVPRTPSQEGARVYIISPANGEKVPSPVTVRFGLTGMGVAPAGVRNPKTGHHHLIIDSELPNFEAPVPADDKHLHFGGGQTQTTIELAPGTHTLQLLMGDHNHVPHTPAVYSAPITIEVE